MREMFENRSIIGQEFSKHRLTVPVITGPENVMVGARDDANCIELHETDSFYRIDEIAGGRVREPLSIQPEPTRIAI